MEKFVREKRFWIYTKLAEKEALGPAFPAKDYVNGEGFPYARPELSAVADR